MIKSGIGSIVFTLAVFLSGCIGDYDVSFDRGPLQIGCRQAFEKMTSEIDSPSKEEDEIKRETNFRFGFPWWMNVEQKAKQKDTTVNGMILSPLLDVDSGTLNGVAVSPIFAYGGTIHGLVIAPVGTMNREIDGVSISCLNWSLDEAWVQAGLMNLTGFLGPAGKSYAQIGVINEGGGAFQMGLLNSNLLVSHERQFGVQFSAINTVTADKFTGPLDDFFGWQTGLINFAPGGVQIGLLNRNDKGWLWKWSPLINFSSQK